MLNSLKHLNAWKHMHFKQIDGKMKSYRSLLKSLSAIEDPIDFVVTWVDGNDPVWQHEKAKYTPDYKKGNTQARYREWNQFMYWFRSVEKYAP